MTMGILRSWLGAVVAFLSLTGCVTQSSYDYSAFKAARPLSILVVPPQNHSPDVKATYAVLAQMTRPLAEAGYYVVPVTLMEMAFRENGLHNPAEIHAVAPAKLRQIFNADAVLYTEITEYGTSYRLIYSETAVAVQARLVDLRSGTLLWTSSARASSAENQKNNQQGLAGLLAQAVVSQIVNNLMDNSYTYAGVASQRLLSPGHNGGILYGPRSPYFLANP